jgi:hypothetical protein
VGISAVTSDAGYPRDLVRRCTSCGTPLTEWGFVELAALDAVIAELDQARALREDRADLERRLTRAKDELKTATRLGDEPARVRVARTIETRQANLAEVDRILAGTKESKPPTDGPCPACQTIFRGGRVDRAAAALAIKARSDRESQLAALEQELAHAQAAVKSDERSAERMEANPRRHAGVNAQAYRDRAAHTSRRIAQIEEAIARVKAELKAARGSAR